MFDLIKKHESFSDKAYLCPAGGWTIGWGCTYYPSGLPVKKGDRITKTEAESLLAWHVNKIIMPAGLNKNQTVAVQSLIFNIGQSAFDKSNLKKAIINKDWAQVYKNWDWVYAKGKFLRGLAKRRAEELLLFFND